MRIRLIFSSIGLSPGHFSEVLMSDLKFSETGIVSSQIRGQKSFSAYRSQRHGQYRYQF